MANVKQAALSHAVRCVKKIPPGESITFSRQFLSDLGSSSILDSDPVWVAIDLNMTQIPDSDYELVPLVDVSMHVVRFQRMHQRLPVDDGRRTYVSPEKRQFYTHDGNFWQRKPD